MMNQDDSESLANSSFLRVGWIEYLYVLMLVLYAGRSIGFFEQVQIKTNPIGVMVPVIFSAFMAFRWRINFNHRFYLLLFFFALYFVAISIKYYVIQPTYIIAYYLMFFTTYVAVATLRYKLFIIYEHFLFLFTVISLFFWTIQVGLGGDALYSVFSKFAFEPPVSNVTGNGFSALFYTIQSYETNLINNATIARNCGFGWEPGIYAVYLCIAVFVNLFLVKKDKFSRIRFWVLFFGVLTTQSTTGYVILMLISLLYLFNKDFSKVLLLLPVVVIVFVAVSSLPFMKEKIVDLISETENIDDLLYMSYGRERNVTPQRFTSLLLTWKDFTANPVLGIAAHYEEQWTYKMGSSISAISGIGNLMAQFGLVGTLFFLVYTAKSSIRFARHFKYRGTLLLFLMLLSITVSYSVIFFPMIMCFWMYSLFAPEDTQQAYNPNEDRSAGFRIALPENKN